MLLLLFSRRKHIRRFRGQYVFTFEPEPLEQRLQIAESAQRRDDIAIAVTLPRASRHDVQPHSSI